MNRKHKFVLVLFSVLFCCQPLEASHLQSQLVEIWQIDTNDMRICDIDQDHSDEIVTGWDIEIRVEDIFRKHIYASFPIPRDTYVGFQPLITGQLDSLKFLMGHYRPDSVIYDIIEWQYVTQEKKVFSRFKSFTGIEKNNDHFDQKMDPILSLITMSDGRKIMPTRLNCAYDVGIRGIAGLDVMNQELVWQYLFGPGVTSLVTRDFDGDGLEEILIGTYAPDNHRSFNGFRDNKSYLFLFNSDGQLLWSKRMGETYFTGVKAEAALLQHNQRPVIVAYLFNYNQKYQRPTEIFVIDPVDGRTLQSQPIAPQINEPIRYFFNEPSICADFNSDGVDEIVVANEAGFIRMFDGSLREIKTSENFGQKVEIHFVVDLNDDDLPEIGLKTSTNDLVILNHELSEICRRKLDFKTNIQIVKTWDRNRILLVSNRQNEWNTYTLLELKNRFITSHSLPYLIWIIVLLALIFLFLLFRTLFWRHQAEQLLFSFLNANKMENSTLILNANGKIHHLGEDWLIFLNPEIQDYRNRPFTQLLNSNADNTLKTKINKIIHKKTNSAVFQIAGEYSYQIHSYYIPVLKVHNLFLVNITENEYLQHIKSWAPVAQRLAHSIKNPLTSIKLNIEDLQDMLEIQQNMQDSEKNQILTSIKEQVVKLHKMTDGFMRLVHFEKPKLEPQDLNAQVQALIPQWAPAGANVVKISYDLQRNLPPILADPEQLTFVLKTAFFNALESISENGRIVITTRVVEIFAGETTSPTIKSFVELQLQDNGCGIPPEYIKKVFTPYFSYGKKEGTGLGLYATQKIMLEHQGAIELTSEPGQGTTVYLRFQTQ